MTRPTSDRRVDKLVDAFFRMNNFLLINIPFENYYFLKLCVIGNGKVWYLGGNCPLRHQYKDELRFISTI